MFHETAEGNIAPCTATVKSCPHATVSEHYATQGEAAHASAIKALEGLADVRVVYPTKRKQQPARSLPVAPPERDASSLSIDDFAKFRDSAANQPAQVTDDWRQTISRNAELNGDAYADAHADTSLVSDYDPTPDDDDD
jgi:hypothetical protein